MEKAINDQIAEEFSSSYIYLAMASYSESINLKGFATWFRMQAEEENTHAFKLYDYLQDRGGKVVLQAIPEPQSEFSSIQDAFEKTLAHEQYITGKINELNALAISENDFATQAHLQWFITEQVEEEATAEDILNQIKMVDAKPGSLFYIDRHIGRSRQQEESA
jgi:ferritin